MMGLVGWINCMSILEAGLVETLSLFSVFDVASKCLLFFSYPAWSNAFLWTYYVLKPVTPIPLDHRDKANL